LRRLLVLLLFSIAGYAQTTTTVTGTIKDLSGAVVTSGQVTFQLQPGLDTTISGSARFSPSIVTCGISGAGAIKALDLVSACTVTYNTALVPQNSYYKVCIQPAFVTGGACFNWYALVSTFDLTTAVPTPGTAPAYTFVDLISNQTISGTKTFSNIVVNSAPAGLSIANPVQSIGNSAIPATLGVTWSTQMFGSDIVPSTSTQGEMDGVFGFIENASTTTNVVGVRGQGQAAANSAKAWGGNFLVTDYDHVPNTYTGTSLNGVEIDMNTKSTTTAGFGMNLIQAGPVVPTTLPAIGISSINSSSWSTGIVCQSGAITAGSNCLQIGSQGATGVANKPSAILSAFGYNSGGVAKGWNFLSSQDGDFIIVPSTGRGVGIGLGGTLTNPTEPGQPLDVSGNIRSSGQLMSTVATGTAPLAITSTTPVANLTASATVYNISGGQVTNAHAVIASCTLGTNCVVTLSGIAVFTSGASYVCVASDATAAAAVKVNQIDGSHVTFTGTGTDVINFNCTGD
jgi:hypothetical protein